MERKHKGRGGPKPIFFFFSDFRDLQHESSSEKQKEAEKKDKMVNANGDAKSWEGQPHVHQVHSRETPIIAAAIPMTAPLRGGRLVYSTKYLRCDWRGASTAETQRERGCRPLTAGKSA